MTLLMRDQENIEKGREQMIVNVLTTTKSVKQTAFILCLDEKAVRNIAEERNILVND